MLVFRILVLLLFCFFGIHLQGQIFDFNDRCNDAYQNIIKLKLKEGKNLLSAEQTIQPNNLIVTFLFSYVDFLEVYTSGSVKLYEHKKKGLENRIAQLKTGDKQSPYYLYTQAETHTQSAVLHIKFGEYISAIFDVKKAVKKLKANQESFPDFVPNKKSLGMLYTILGSMPQQYQGTLKFLGLSGDLNKGLNMLRGAANNQNHLFQHEAATVYAFMLLHIQNDPDEAWSVLVSNGFDAKQNLMDAYSLGHIGIYGNYCDKGIDALLSRPKGSEYSSFPLTDFLLGIGKTYKQDADANTYFRSFLDQNKGEDYLKSAWQKMAWNKITEGDKASYTKYLNKVSQVGRAVTDTDKQAAKELKIGVAPNPVLLKARLLTDGNYLTRALEVLSSQTVNSFKNKYDKTEYFYRKARIFDKAKQFDKAIQYYQITIANGRSVPYYYAANSAYLLGFLFEQQENFTEAIKNYNLCLSLDGYEYENSIHQKAAAALNRLNE